ncbi:hypothetical protein DdX_19934 [Ditylenchus destructor]|uniref:Uncharacterized protein n=1 Tax=Ditylenchus destructor TaxID=166010 RepID=A0AAD4MIN7_9BILA|nr:hypothetical protein DdX_19934 [Ditylenchus destructor]
MSQSRKISSFFTQRPAKRPAAEPIDTDVEIDEPETSGAATPMEVGPSEPDFGTDMNHINYYTLLLPVCTAYYSTAVRKINK